MFKHLNRSTRPEINTNKLDTPTPSSINPYVNLVAEQLYNKANPNEYVVVFRVTYTGTLVDQLLSTQFRNQISLAVYEQLKNKLFAYIVVQPDDDSLQDTKHIFVKTNATSNNELVFTNFSDKGDSTTLSIKKNGSAFLVNVSVSDNSSVISTTLLSKINALSNKVDGVSGSIQYNSEAIELNKTRINQLQQSINGTDSDVANLEDRLDKLEDGLADGVIELTNYVTKEEFNVVANASQDNAEKLKKVYTIEEVDIEVNDLRQEVGNYYVKKTDQRIKSVDYNIQTGIFTFTKQDGTIFEVDLAIEKVVTNFIYNKQKNALELTLADGTVQSIPMSDFASAYEGVENDQIQVSIQSGNKIQAILKNGSININHLEPEFANDVGAMVTTVSELLNHVQDNAEAIANTYTKAEANSTFGYKTDIIALQNRATVLESKFTADLTGSKWTLFNPLPDDTPDFEYNLTFVSNGATFTKIAYNKEQYIGLAYINSSGGVTTAYNASDKIWSETNYQTIEITGGTDVTNLEAIGTLKTIGARISGGINVDDNVKAELEALNIRVNGVSARVTALEQNQGTGSGGSSTVFETQQIDIAVSDWTELPDSEPYTYFANVTLSKSLDNAISIELVNNNPILFAKYGFAIGEITAMDELEIYSIGKPNDSVTLTFETVSQTSSVNLISFTIDGTSYSAEEGMTWGEWCNSEYNTIGASIYNEINVGVDNKYIALATDVIKANGTYTISQSGGGI